MQLDPVRSTNLRAVGWDADTQMLEIEFANGRVYQYIGVPREVYEGLMASGSKGTYVYQNIKNQYKMERVA